MTTCNEVVNLGSPVRSERVRGFQPPWYTVLTYRCPNGHEARVRQSWSGGMVGGIRCGHAMEIPFTADTIAPTMSAKEWQEGR